MKVVVRNPSLPVLVGWILMGLSVHKSERRRDWRAGPETGRVAESHPSTGLAERIRQAWNLWKLRRREAMKLSLRH
jgi:hypothetical protein